MKKLILGLVIFAASLFAFTDMYNTTSAILMTRYTEPLGQIISVLITAFLFILAMAGLVIAEKAARDKRSEAEDYRDNKNENEK